jgi:hypothetical protein
MLQFTSAGSEENVSFDRFSWKLFDPQDPNNNTVVRKNVHFNFTEFHHSKLKDSEKRLELVLIS